MGRHALQMVREEGGRKEGVVVRLVSGQMVKITERQDGGWVLRSMYTRSGALGVRRLEQQHER